MHTEHEGILVTGGAGFIGSNLLSHLMARWPKHRITVLDAMRYRLGERNVAEQVGDSSHVTLRVGSVTDPELVEELVADADVIVHLAVETANEARFLDVQLTGTKILLDAAHRLGVRRFVFQSTSDLYGITTSDDLTEDAPIRATTLYAATKLGAEGLVTAYYHTFGVPAVIVRPVSIYGPRQYPGWLISRFVALALADKPLTIMGDGLARRDWIHVDDVCRALVSVIEHPGSGVEGEVFNLGTGQEHTVKQVAEQILQAFGKPASQVRYTAARPADLPRQVSRAAKARRVLGWAPTVAFEQGLERTIDWYRRHPGWLAEQAIVDLGENGSA